MRTVAGTFDADAPVWEIPIVNFVVGSIQFGGELWLLAHGSHAHGLSAQHRTKISLASLFSFVASDGARHELDGGGEWDRLIPVFSLRGAVITTAIAHQDKHKVLSLTFDSGATLIAPPDRDGWEAWGVSGPDSFGLLIG